MPWMLSTCDRPARMARSRRFRNGHPVEIDRLEPSGGGRIGNRRRHGRPGAARRRLALAPLLLLRVRDRLQLRFLADHRHPAHHDTVAAAGQDLEHLAVLSETDDGHGGTDREGHDFILKPQAAGINPRSSSPV